MTTSLTQLKQHLLEKAKSCIHPPAGQLKYRYATPTYAITAGGDDDAAVSDRSLTGHYLQMYDWDSCLFAQAAWRFGDAELPVQVVSNFLSLQEEDGFIPRTVSPQRIWDKGDICKPFLSQSLLGTAQPPAADQYKHLLPALCKYLAYFDRHRRHANGLYNWRNVLESGVDDNLALLAPQEAAKDENQGLGDFPDGILLAVDLSSYLAKEKLCLLGLAGQCNDEKTSRIMARQAAELVESIEKYMWCPELGMYTNIYPDSGEKVRLRAWTGLAPVLMGFASETRADEVIATNIMNEEHFLRPTGLASVAASEPLYNQSKRGLYGRVIVSHWQGPMWVLPNALAVRALLLYEHKNEAIEIARRVTRTLSNSLESHGTLYENYHAETGAPLWAPQFMSWNILALELIQLLES